MLSVSVNTVEMATPEMSDSYFTALEMAWAPHPPQPITLGVAG